MCECCDFFWLEIIWNTDGDEAGSKRVSWQWIYLSVNCIVRESATCAGELGRDATCRKGGRELNWDELGGGGVMVRYLVLVWEKLAMVIRVL